MNQATSKSIAPYKYYGDVFEFLPIWPLNLIYRKVSNIRGTLVGNEIVDYSVVVGASPVGADPTASSFSS